jgi:hypothetical protein
VQNSKPKRSPTDLELVLVAVSTPFRTISPDFEDKTYRLGNHVVSKG